MKNDIAYRLGIMLEAAKSAMLSTPTIERARECRDLRRQLREA